MRWKKTLQLIEVHAEGEVGKVLYLRISSTSRAIQ